jgi:uncharacterized glyoxalase superfamily protein PhnB
LSKLTRVAPEVPAADLQAALAYYEQQLGFRTSVVMPDGEYAIVERDAVAIHLFQSALALMAPVGIHLFIEGIEELHQEFVHRGAQIREGIVVRPWGARDFRVADLSGNQLKFTEPIPDDEN